jgi:predicted MarR family transcription regulator
VPFASHVDPRHVPANDRQTLELSSAVVRTRNVISSCHLDFLSEHARPGWPFVDSGLGESYESLTNVQLPS